MSVCVQVSLTYLYWKRTLFDTLFKIQMLLTKFTEMELFPLTSSLLFITTHFHLGLPRLQFFKFCLIFTRPFTSQFSSLFLNGWIFTAKSEATLPKISITILKDLTVKLHPYQDWITTRYERSQTDRLQTFKGTEGSQTTDSRQGGEEGRSEQAALHSSQ